MDEVDELAMTIARRMLARAGVAKSAGSMASVLPDAITAAAFTVEAAEYVRVAMLNACDRGGVDAVLILAAEVGSACRMGGPVVVEKGQRRFDPAEFHVGLVPNSPPKKMNGYRRSDREAGYVPPPEWHPESND